MKPLKIISIGSQASGGLADKAAAKAGSSIVLTTVLDH